MNHKNHNCYQKQDINDSNGYNAGVKNHNYEHELRECMHRGYMPNYYRNNSMYSRPLVGRLKTRLSVNFVHKNSQTVYNSKV